MAESYIKPNLVILSGETWVPLAAWTSITFNPEGGGGGGDNGNSGDASDEGRAKPFSRPIWTQEQYNALLKKDIWSEDDE